MFFSPLFFSEITWEEIPNGIIAWWTCWRTLISAAQRSNNNLVSVALSLCYKDFNPTTVISWHVISIWKLIANMYTFCFTQCRSNRPHTPGSRWQNHGESWCCYGISKSKSSSSHLRRKHFLHFSSRLLFLVMSA